MTPTHIMLTEQGFVALEMPRKEFLFWDDGIERMIEEDKFLKKMMSTSVLFAPEEQGKIRDVLFNHLVWLENDVVDGWQPTKNIHYTIPDGVEVEIREEIRNVWRCKEDNILIRSELQCSVGVRGCKCNRTQLAYLKTKEVKEESQDQIIEDLIATWQATCGAVTGDEYSEVKRKFKVTRI